MTTSQLHFSNVIRVSKPGYKCALCNKPLDSEFYSVAECSHVFHKYCLILQAWKSDPGTGSHSFTFSCPASHIDCKSGSISVECLAPPSVSPSANTAEVFREFVQKNKGVISYTGSILISSLLSVAVYRWLSNQKSDN